jgi:hypothetical protein
MTVANFGLASRIVTTEDGNAKGGRTDASEVASTHALSIDGRHSRHRSHLRGCVRRSPSTHNRGNAPRGDGDVTLAPRTPRRRYRRTGTCERECPGPR